MGRYAKLGTMAGRWTAIGFFVLAFILLPFGLAAGGRMGGTMGGMTGGAMMGGPMGGMMGGGPATAGPAGAMMPGTSAIWWGPLLLDVAMGALLFALSKPIGSLIAMGLDA